MKKKNELSHVDNPLYHSTWTLLRKCRDVVWSLELSVQQVHNTFEIEYGNTVEEFLDPIYLTGVDLISSAIEHHVQCTKQSHKMLKLLGTATDLPRTKHKNKGSFYWLLYHSSLSSQRLRNANEAIEKLRPHIRDISLRTYYQRRREVIGALSSVPQGYTVKDSMAILEQFSPDQLHGKKSARD